MEIVNEFNTTSNMFLDLLYSFTRDSDISFYKKAMNKMIQGDNNILIEQFIINCLIYNVQIQNKDYKYFVDIEIKDKVKVNDSKSLLNVTKIKGMIEKFDSNKISLIFDYLQLLCNFSIEYLHNKVK
jgi:hypothetical protein